MVGFPRQWPYRYSRGRPRTRGDGPGGADSSGLHVGSAPHPREWSVGELGQYTGAMSAPHPRGSFARGPDRG